MVRKEGLLNPSANKRDRKFRGGQGSKSDRRKERDWARERLPEKQ